jgi:DNA-binding beta-propeller fold protein YncE
MKKANLLTLVLLFPCAFTYAQGKTGMHIVNKLKINSDGGWDYLSIDVPHQRIYVSHGNQVNILNEITGDSVGYIPGTKGVHGIAIAGPFGKGYTSNGKSASCTVFDLKNYKIIREITVGENPDALFYDEYSKNVIVFNGRGQSASIINPVSDKVVATIPLGGKPEAGVSDGKGTIYVNIEDKNEIVAFDIKTNKVKKRYKLQTGEEPSGLAIDQSRGRLFSVCSNKQMIVLDIKTGQELAVLPIGEGSDGVVYDPILKRAYSSNGEGNITVVQELQLGKFEVLETIKTAKGARTIALNTKTHHLFLPTADFTPSQEKGKRPQRVPGTFRILEIGK